MQTLLLTLIVNCSLAESTKTKRDYYTTARAILEDTQIEDGNDERENANDDARFFRRKQAAAAAAAAVLKESNQRHPDGSYNYE